MKMKSISILLVMLIIATVFCVSISAAAEYTVNNHDSTFTVKGETLTSYMADVDTDADNTGDTEAIKDGYFHESEFRAAPYFNVQIDGINLLDQNFGS